MRDFTFLRRLLALTAGAWIAGCTPAVYEQQVVDFNAGVQEAVLLVEQERALENADRNARRDRRLAEQRPAIQLDPNCQDVITELDDLIAEPDGRNRKTMPLDRCGLRALDANGNPTGSNLADADALNDSVRLARALGAYAAALALIVRADDDAVEAETAALGGSGMGSLRVSAGLGWGRLASSGSIGSL